MIGMLQYLLITRNGLRLVRVRSIGICSNLSKDHISSTSHQQQLIQTHKGDQSISLIKLVSRLQVEIEVEERDYERSSRQEIVRLDQANRLILLASCDCFWL